MLGLAYEPIRQEHDFCSAGRVRLPLPYNRERAGVDAVFHNCGALIVAQGLAAS
jgi:hypothetical protein